MINGSPHMNHFASPLLIATLAMCLGVALGWWSQVRHRSQVKRWPTSFKLHARPVFSTDERLLYRELKAALPQHVVLAKVNLLRFCQSASEREARLWFERLQSANVSFAICTPNGTVVSVIDIETPNKRGSVRTQRLKEAVLETCRIRYVRCLSGHWPKPALLTTWALGGSLEADAGVVHTTNHGFSDTSPLGLARTELAQKLTRRRAERASLFQDSSFASDSFFATDGHFDMAANSAPTPLESATVAAAAARG